MIKAVIIDDVDHAIITLRQDLTDYCPEVEVIGTAEGVVSGAKLIRQCQPDVVFLDIQMQDGSGFDLLEILDNTDFKLIFTTASDNFAIKAFKYSAIDYLLKPIDPDELTEAVNKTKQSSADNEASIELLKDNIKSEKTPERLALGMADKIRITNINEIVRCEANVNYTLFFLVDGEELLVTRPLKEFDELLRDHGFLRVHQSHLINMQQIREYMKIDGGYIVMTNGSEVPVSSRKKKEVVDLIRNL